MKLHVGHFATAFLVGLFSARAFQPNAVPRKRRASSIAASSPNESDLDGSRRDLIASAVVVPSACLIGMTPKPAHSAVGALPEFADTNAVLQGLTVRVADKSQQDAMISFLTESFDFVVLRKRIKGNVEETWLGFGPEQLDIPSDFVLPVSSFSKYGGHASIRILFDSKTRAPLYRTGEQAPGDSIAYLQVAVPAYRISKMTNYGGNILDAYGHIDVVSPAGLPIRGIVGFTPDPMMFVAINCVNVQTSKSYYQQLGFVELEVPYSRPSKGATIFEPAPPSSAVYMAPSKNSMGVLLLPFGKKKLSPNPVVDSLNLVYSPAPGSEGQKYDPILDPSGVSISFQPVGEFEKEEKETR